MNNILITKEVKSNALQQQDKSAARIVKDVQLRLKNTSAPSASFPNTNYLQRAAKRIRANLRPMEPRDLEFSLDWNHIPEDFLVKDVKVDGQRHLIFSKSAHLRELSNAIEWYVGRTFEVVAAPFIQLWSIHTFVKSGEHMKQVPLVYVVMSRRSKKDYVKVLKKLKKAMPTEPEVQKIICDFESACWSAFTDVFPTVQGQGCAFHWTQAVWRNIQGMGLQTLYSSVDQTHHYLRLLMALPFLTPDDIPTQFEWLERKAAKYSVAVQDVVRYIRRMWIESNIWPPATWSVFGRSVRTYEDVVGWHRHLIGEGGHRNLGLYQLAKVLHEEAELLGIEIVLVTEKKLKRYKRKNFCKSAGKIQELWSKNKKGELSAKKLLEAISEIHGPVH